MIRVKSRFGRWVLAAWCVAAVWVTLEVARWAVGDRPVDKTEVCGFVLALVFWRPKTRGEDLLYALFLGAALAKVVAL